MDISGTSPVLWQVFSQKGVSVIVDDAVQEILPSGLLLYSHTVGH